MPFPIAHAFHVLNNLIKFLQCTIMGVISNNWDVSLKSGRYLVIRIWKTFIYNEHHYKLPIYSVHPNYTAQRHPKLVELQARKLLWFVQDFFFFKIYTHSKTSELLFSLQNHVCNILHLTNWGHKPCSVKHTHLPQADSPVLEEHHHQALPFMNDNFSLYVLFMFTNSCVGMD